MVNKVSNYLFNQLISIIRYRSEIRLSSDEGGSLPPFECPVWAAEDIEDESNINHNDIFHVSMSDFECHNGGVRHFDKQHNIVDGKVEVPVLIKVKKIPLEEGEVE